MWGKNHLETQISPNNVEKSMSHSVLLICLSIYKRRPIIFIRNNLSMRGTKSFQDFKPPRKQKSDKQEPV